MQILKNNANTKAVLQHSDIQYKIALPENQGRYLP